MTPAATVLLSILFLSGATAVVYGQGSAWETLTDRAELLYQQGQYDRAVMVAKQALAVAEQALGPNHPSVATTLHNLATFYGIQGQYAQAEPLYQRVLAIQTQALGAEVDRTWNKPRHHFVYTSADSS